MVGGAGECAWPMERTECSFDGCDATIGGRSHAEEGGNKIQREYLTGNNENFPAHKAVKAPKGYVLRCAIASYFICVYFVFGVHCKRLRDDENILHDCSP